MRGDLAFAAPPPQNRDAEMLVLGALIVHPDSRARIGVLDREVFWDPQLRRAFEVVSARIAAGDLADPVTLKTAFEQDPDLNTELLTMLGERAATPINASQYANELRRVWAQRRRDDVLRDAVIANRQAQPGEDVVTPLIWDLGGIPAETPAGRWRDRIDRVDMLALDNELRPVREFIIDEWAGKGWPIALTGLGGKGKTTVAQLAATCVAMGYVFYGCRRSGGSRW